MSLNQSTNQIHMAHSYCWKTNVQVARTQDSAWNNNICVKDYATDSGELLSSDGLQARLVTTE